MGTGCQGAHYVLIGVVGGQNDDRRVGGAGGELLGSPEPIEHRHPDIHQEHVSFLEAIEGLLAVMGLTCDGDIRGTPENHGQAGADQCVVVDDAYPDRFSRLAHAGQGIEACATNRPSGVGP